MLVNAHEIYRVKKPARINETKGSVKPGATLHTLTQPMDKHGAVQVLVEYKGGGTRGEATNGTKFWLKLTALAQLAVREH